MSLKTFRDFFFEFLKPYKCVGLAPFKKNKNNFSVNFSYPLLWVIVLCVLFYWIGIVITFMEDRSKSHNLSVIANWIQIIANAIALTVAFTYPMMQKQTVSSIIKLFERVDEELNCLKIKVNYREETRNYRIFISVCFFILLASSIYDFFVTILFLKTLKPWYWFVTILPLLVYSIALSQAFLVIGFIKKRCQMINEVIWEFHGSIKASKVNAKNLALISIFNDTNPIISLSNLFSKLFIALNELCELSQHVELFFGPLFLTTFAAIFAVTSIQLFYCYLYIISLSEERYFSIWALIQSLDIICINLLLILGITSVCEGVSTQVRFVIPVDGFTIDLLFRQEKHYNFYQNYKCDQKR